MKKLAIVILLISLTFNSNASIPENMPQAVYDGIVNQVITDVDHYDAVLVEEAITQWLLEQDLPSNDGELTESGACTDCEADPKGVDNDLPQARNVKIKAKQNNGSFTTTYKIKWKRPANLPNDSIYEFSHYNVYVSKDGASFDTFKVTPKIKRNGRPKKKNKIKFKNSEEGNYTVQVQAVYTESTETNNETVNKSSGNHLKSVTYVSSGWTNQKLYTLQKNPLHVSDLSGQLKNCINQAGYDDTTLLRIFTKIDCRNSGLLDSDIAQIEDFGNLRVLIIDNNLDVTDISPLENLAYLTFLSLEYNSNINLNFNNISELEDLYLGHMGLTMMPDLSSLTDLEFIDLSNNQISSGFSGNLPDSLTVLVLDENLIHHCGGLAGLEIETISIQGENIKNFQNCSQVVGLKYLTIKDAPFITGTHNIDDFSGFCSLDIDNTGIKKLNGSRPIYNLRLASNLLLEKNELIKSNYTDNKNDYPDLIPSFVDLSGSHNMSCKNVYNKKNKWNTTAKLDMSIPVYTKSNNIVKTSESCPTIAAAKYYREPSVCQPDIIEDANVIKAKQKNKYNLSWSTQNHDTWNVSRYEIMQNSDASTITPLLPNPNFPLTLLNNAIAPTFEVRACTVNLEKQLESCGPWSLFTVYNGLGKVENTQRYWQGASDNLFKIEFNYPQALTNDDSSTPDYFSVSAGPLEKNPTPINDIPFTNNTQIFETPVINLDDYLSNEFRIRACKVVINNEHICGQSVLVKVRDRVIIGTDPTLIPPTPTTNIGAVSSSTDGIISIPLFSSKPIDYFEIAETQPVAIVDSKPQANQDNIKFYTIKAQQQNNISTAKVDLIRKVNGDYHFSILGCKTYSSRSKPICTPLESPLVHEHTVTRSVLNNYLELNEPDANIISLNWAYIDCDVDEFGNNLEAGCVNEGGNISNYPNFNYHKKGIIWNYSAGAITPAIDQPDYFYLSKVVLEQGGVNKHVQADYPYNSINTCVSKQAGLYDVNTNTTTNPMYAKQQIFHTNVLTDFSTHMTGVDCSEGIRVNGDTLWRVQACYSGVGCTNGKTIDLNNPAHERSYNIPDQSDHSPTEAAIDELESGLWWNPHQSTNGWYFYWKNNSENPDVEVTESKDLLTYWVSYRKVDGEWKPIWLHARMTLQESDDEGDQFYSGQVFYSSVDIATNQKSELGAGTISVRLNEDFGTSYKAKVELNIDGTNFYDSNIVTSSSINFDDAGELPVEDEFKIIYNYDENDLLDSIVIPLEIASIRLVGDYSPAGTTTFGDDNNYDHFQGIWQYDDINDINDVTMAIWKVRNLETSNMFIYDSVGQPLWIWAQSCGDPCSEPVPEYFDKYINNNEQFGPGTSSDDIYNFVATYQGFNPLSYRPINSDLGTEYVAESGRQFIGFPESDNLKNYQEAKFWLKFNSSALHASSNIDLGNKPTGSMGFTNYEVLTKIANKNHIGFNLQDYAGNIQYEDEQETIVSNTCNPDETGYCTLSLNWYVDDTSTHQPLRVYYKHEDMSEFAPLTIGLDNITCLTSVPNSKLVNSYQCKGLIEGTYDFQLRRKAYDLNENQTAYDYYTIAESATLTSMPCLSENCNFDEETVLKSQDPFIPGVPVDPNNPNTLSLDDLPAAPPTSATVGKTNGSFSVSPNGAANYSIPILTAPGSGGLVPQVSINYNSQSSRSALGKGWSVSGYSAISRCGQTFAQDYNETSSDPLVLGVNFSSSDRFCVNGQRLFLKSGDSYGADGATYETEINDFTKYTSYGDDTPECFIAQHKNGSKTYYGKCNNGSNNNTGFVDSGLEALDSNDDGIVSNMALMWAQSRMVDNKGNFYDNFYISEVVLENNEPMVRFYLDKIMYTSNLSLSTGSGLLKGIIQLDYSQLDDDQKTSSVISVFPHVKTYSNLKLDSITSSYLNDDNILETIRHYELIYGNTDAAGFDLLTSVKECSDDSITSCLESLKFTWGNTSKVAPTDESTNIDDLTIPPPTVQTNSLAIRVNKFDANNDGLEDFYVESSKLKIGIAQADGSGFVMINGPNYETTNSLHAKVADINADGFPDFIHQGKVYLWKGNNEYELTTLEFNATNLYANELYDFNGDGLVDIVNFISSTGNLSNSKIKIYINRMDITRNIETAFTQEVPLEFDLDLLNYYKDNLSTIFYDSDNSIASVADNLIIDYIELNQVSDINGDGVPEFVLDITMNIKCIVVHPTCSAQSGPIGTVSMIKLKAIAYLIEDENSNFGYETQHLAGGNNCLMCNKRISNERFVDVTGDGQPELCYIEYNYLSSIPNNWKCQSELGDKNTTTILNLPTIVDIPLNTSNGENITSLAYVDYQDLDGDGDLDFMYSAGSTYNKWKWNDVSWENGGITFVNEWKNTEIISGRAIPQENNYHVIDANLFIDINHDGLIDHLNFDVAENGSAVQVKRFLADSSAANANKEKIIKITDSFGKDTEIEYDFMSTSDIYTPDDNSDTEWFDEHVTLNRYSPVYDFNSSMSLVRAYHVDMPAYGNEFIESYEYQYFYGKLQAGGRGFLGFGQVNVYDLNKQIFTKTEYRQDFPFTGQIETVVTSRIKADTSTEMLRMISNNYSDSPCWVDGTCDSGIPEPIICPPTEINGCGVSYRGELEDNIEKDVISIVTTTWAFNELEVGSKSSYQTYAKDVLSENYELSFSIDPDTGKEIVSNDIIGTSFTVSLFNELNGDVNYGNPTTISEYSYEKDDFDYVDANDEGNYAFKKTTNINYCYFDKSLSNTAGCDDSTIQTGEYSVKPNQTVVTYTRPTADVNNPLVEIRTTNYEYNSNRLLKDEKMSVPNEIYTLTKTHSDRDPFGNPEKTIISYGNNNIVDSRNSENYFDNTGRFVNESKISTETEQLVLSRNKFGSPTHTKNKQGISTFYAYDDFGKLYYQINELGQYSRIKYSSGALNNCAAGTKYFTTTTSSGPTIWQCFDKLGREITTLTQGLNEGNIEKISRVDKRYDTRGNLYEQSVPTFNTPNQWQRFEYDYIDRILLSTNAKGEVTTTSYEPLIMRVTNARDFATITETNIMGEIISITNELDPDITTDDISTTYEYDAKGNQTMIDGPLIGDEIITEYNNFDQVIKITDPDLGVWTYKYNLFGEIEYQRDAEGNCTDMTFDTLGRLWTKTYRKDSGSECIVSQTEFKGQSEWVYDQDSSHVRDEYTDINQTPVTFGLLTQEKIYTDSIRKTFIYDSFARPISTATLIRDNGTDVTYFQKSYYDQYSRLLASEDATGGSVRYTYNEQGYQTETTDQIIRKENGENLVYQTINNIDAFGNLKTFTAGNGVSTTLGYDALGRVTYTNTGNGIQILNYQYDNVGNLDKRTDARNTADIFVEDYIYDGINRLQEVTATAGTITHVPLSFTYDKGGRIESFKNNFYNYEGSGHIHGVNNIGSKLFDYDNNGNQTDSDGRTLVYNSFNKVVNMYKTSDSSTSVQFEYDANNSRYKRIDRGADEYETTLYIGNVEIITNDNFGTTKTKRYIADAVVTKDLGSNTEVINYLHKDHLGSLQVVTDDDGIDLKHLSFDAFGLRREMNSDRTNFDYLIDTNPIPDVTKDGFTGQEHIDQLGVINFNARLYDPSLGIMLQADTIIPDGPVTQSMNRYSYVFNNPLSYTDPTGHYAVKNPYTKEKSLDDPLPPPPKAKKKSPDPKVYYVRSKDEQEKWKKKLEAKGYTVITGVFSGSFVRPDSSGTLTFTPSEENQFALNDADARWDPEIAKYVPDYDVTYPTWSEMGSFTADLLIPYYSCLDGCSWGEVAWSTVELIPIFKILKARKAAKITRSNPVLNASQIRAIRGLEGQIVKHQKKLSEWKNNPMDYDNKGFLKNISPNRREEIIQSRINSLEHQINTFKSDINAIQNGTKTVLEKAK